MEMGGLKRLYRIDIQDLKGFSGLRVAYDHFQRCIRRDRKTRLSIHFIERMRGVAGESNEFV